VEWQTCTDVSKGTDKAYNAQLAWQTLLWSNISTTLAVRHLDNGPTLIMKCHWFTPTLADETSLFWKAKEGWRAITTAAVGLKDPVKALDTYVSQCATFYLKSPSEDMGYIRPMLSMMKTLSQVGSTRIKP
jgi:hypothetical protein